MTAPERKPPADAEPVAAEPKSSDVLLGELVHEIAALARREVELAAVRHGPQVRQVVIELSAALTAGAALLLAAAALSWAAVQGLALAIPSWSASLVVAAGILDAAEFFDGRLPEAFGGYERRVTKYPVQYPTACSPQAWSTGTPLLLLRTMLGLEPHGDNLVVDPALPTSIGHLELLDIPGRWGRIDAFGRGRVEVGKRRARR